MSSTLAAVRGSSGVRGTAGGEGGADGVRSDDQ